MPSYSYLCSECDERTEIHASIGTARRVIDCAYCGKLARIRIGADVQIAPSALENRGAPVRAIDRREGEWHKDMPAYYRMRKHGMQPRGIDGAAALEDRVGDSFDVKYDRLYPALEAEGMTRETARKYIQDGEEHAKEIMEESGAKWPGEAV